MDLRGLVDKSDTHRKILKFFFENPACVDTPRGVATWVRCDRHKAEQVLDELAGMGLLIAHKTSSTSGYSLARSRSVVSAMRKVFA
ncbi:MAG: hypothetical protein ABH885_03275 [Candidatus Omnitrophota bacterium]